MIRKLFLLKSKFAFASALATAVDYLIFALLADKVFVKAVANIFSRSAGMVVNFFLHNAFVFDRKRSLGPTFVFSMLVSIGGIVLGSLLLWWMGDWTVWGGNKYYPKFVETGLVFFYNFYLKRFVFEKKFIDR